MILRRVGIQNETFRDRAVASKAAASGGTHHLHHGVGAVGRNGCVTVPGISRTFLNTGWLLINAPLLQGLTY